MKFPHRIWGLWKNFRLAMREGTAKHLPHHHVWKTTALAGPGRSGQMSARSR